MGEKLKSIVFQLPSLSGFTSGYVNTVDRARSMACALSRCRFVMAKTTGTKNKDQQFFGRDAAPLDLEVVQSRESFLYDPRGKKYIDFLSGWCVGNWGWGERVMEQTTQWPHPAYVHPSLLYKPWADLAEMLVNIAPGKLAKCFRATGGSEAVEAAMQIAMLYTKRSKFVSIEGAYHGNTIGALSIGASETRKKYPNLLPGCCKIEPPLNEKALVQVEKLLKKKDVAAFIMEPIICNLGVLIPEIDFMQELPGLCKKYGTLLVMDEVATGFGRTGKLFASEHYGIEPDVLCLAKAITGGYAPLGATLTTDKVARYIKKDFHFYSTYGWHPVSVNAAIANVSRWTRYKNERLEHVEEISRVFETRLRQMPWDDQVEIRVKGLAMAIELKNSKKAGKIEAQCLKKGLLLQADEEKITLFPPLSISKKNALEGLKILESCI